VWPRSLATSRDLAAEEASLLTLGDPTFMSVPAGALDEGVGLERLDRRGARDGICVGDGRVPSLIPHDARSVISQRDVQRAPVHSER
jgi:hypothetical protein